MLKEKFQTLLEKYDLKNYDFLQDDCCLIEKWNWDYEDSHSFQRECLNFLKDHKKFKAFIFCSHPHVFTLGRGLQKDKGRVIEGLIPFDENLSPNLPYPLYHIERGGGLTFHYPNQWIFYPIVNLTAREFTLPGLIDFTLNSLKEILSQKSSEIIEIKLKEKAGLWIKNQKIASLGFALERYITFHGLALNLDHDSEMFSHILKLNPCGLNPEVYRTFNQEKELLSREELNHLFTNSLKKHLSI